MRIQHLPLVLTVLGGVRITDVQAQNAPDCSEPPCDTGTGTGDCPLAFVKDMMYSLDQLCCRQHRVTQSDLVNEYHGHPVTKMPVGTLESPCDWSHTRIHASAAISEGVPRYCTSECAASLEQFDSLCGHLDFLNDLSGYDAHGLISPAFTDKCAFVRQHPDLNDAPAGLNIDCDLGDQVSFICAIVRTKQANVARYHSLTH